MQRKSAITIKLNKTDRQQSIIKHFENLPDDMYIRIWIVAVLFSVSESQIWRWVRAGRLHSTKLSSRVTGFRVGDVKALLNGGV